MIETFDRLKLSEDELYFSSPFGLGDTAILCMYRQALENKYKGKVCFLIKPAHEVIMKMYGIINYIVINFPHCEIADAGSGHIAGSPKKGKIYIAHPLYHDWAKGLVSKLYAPENRTYNFLNFYKEFLGLNQDIDVSLPVWCPQITEKLQAKIGRDIKETMVIVPESNSMKPFGKDLWPKIIKENKQEYFIQNTLKAECFIQGIPNIDLTVEELVALCCHCKKVYTVRSGVCDLVYFYQKNMVVYYPCSKPIEDDVHYVLSMKSMYGISIPEYCYKDSLCRVIHTNLSVFLARVKRKLGKILK